MKSLLKKLQAFKECVNANSQPISGDLENIRMEPVSVSREEIHLKQLNETPAQNKTLYMIGFDVLQIPRFKANRPGANNRW